MSEIKKAKKEILATMDLVEELKYPLPSEYFSLLNKKAKSKIKIKRVIFGSLKTYKLFLKQVKGKKIFFTGKHTKSRNYKRMIIVDGDRIFFKTKNKFYFTTHNKYIKEYKAYFNKLS